MLLFPIQDLLSYESCYSFLKNLLHPRGLSCGCGVGVAPNAPVHKQAKNGLISYKCKQCGSVFNIFTRTLFSGIHYNCITIVLILRGIAQGVTTLHLSKELRLNYKNLLSWRHILQEYSYENRSMSMLVDKVVESDEVFINAGEKGLRHSCSDDPPRVRANKKKG